MLDQYFGIKELYEVVLKAAQPMQFGGRQLEVGEPVLYFKNVNISLLSEKNAPIMARGGWSNMPRVIWEDRSEVVFTLSEGVVSSISLGVLLSANMSEKKVDGNYLLISKCEEHDLEILKDDEENEYHVLYLEHEPAIYPERKAFIYEYERDVAQRKLYGVYHSEYNKINPFTDKTEYCIFVFKDKEKTINADVDKHYLVDYYYKYEDEALIYLIQKERFNGLFTLEGKFYSKDENDGLNYTNLIYMPKVRVVSDINLRLGERADPTTSVFNIIGLPSVTANSKNLILEITRLNQDIDGM